MPNIHPNMNIVFDLDAIQDCEDVRLELKRSYAFVAGSVAFEVHGEVLDADADVDPYDPRSMPGSVVRLNVSLCAPYWDARDGQSETTWIAFKKWLRDKLAKVANAMEGVDACRARRGAEPLAFRWLDLNMRGAADVRIGLGPDGLVGTEVIDLLESVRAAMGAGELGTSVAYVSVPAEWAYEEQLACALEELRVADEAARVACGDEGDAETPDSGDELGDPGDPCGRDARALDGEVSDGPLPETDAQEAVADVRRRIPRFEVDCTVWGIAYLDGTRAVFDSRSRELGHGRPQPSL